MSGDNAPLLVGPELEKEIESKLFEEIGGGTCLGGPTESGHCELKTLKDCGKMIFNIIS